MSVIKKYIIVILTVCGFFTNGVAQHNKEHVKDIVFEFGGQVTEESITTFVDSLIANSIDSSHVCFISLFAWNNCDMIAKDVFEVVKIAFLNDLVGKNITVSIKRERQPWEEDDFYMIHFLFTHLENVEHLALHQ